MEWSKSGWGLWYHSLKFFYFSCFKLRLDCLLRFNIPRPTIIFNIEIYWIILSCCTSFNATCNHFLVCVSWSVLMYHSCLISASVSSVRDRRQAQHLTTHLPHAEAHHPFSGTRATIKLHSFRALRFHFRLSCNPWSRPPDVSSHHSVE